MTEDKIKGAIEKWEMTDGDCEVLIHSLHQMFKEKLISARIEESNQLQRLIVLATKWIPKDHHDWEELNNMGWEQLTKARG